MDAIALSIRQAEQDDGTAWAFIYMGKDIEQKRFVQENLQVYAMVRPSEDRAQRLRRVDYFLPKTMITETEQTNLVACGFVRVGYIDDHYNDVFGLSSGIVDDTIEQYSENLTVALYSRLESITAAEAAAMADAWWLRSPPSFAAEKEAIVCRLHDYRRGVRKIFANVVGGQPE